LKEKLITRRDFLILTLAGAIGGGAGYLGSRVGQGDTNKRFEEINRVLLTHKNAILNQMNVNTRQDKTLEKSK
jgi:hypothetical protein